MWEHHLWNLFSKSWSNLLSGLSTSGLAVVTFSVAVPALTFAASFFHKALHTRNTGQPRWKPLKKRRFLP